MVSSFIRRFNFEQLPIKGAMVVLEDCWQQVASQQNYPAALRQLLGELLASNVLLTTNLKLVGKVICQIQNNSNFKLVVSECSHDLSLRATAKFDFGQIEPLTYADLFSNGSLVVSIDAKNDANLYQSIIALNGNSMGDLLNHYMAQSEQLRSWFLIAYGHNKVVGFLLQQLPDMDEQYKHEIERVFCLASTLTKQELLNDEASIILTKLFNEDNLRLYDAQTVQFSCNCSRERVSDILRSLGKEEIETLINEQGSIVVDCDYCNAHYNFSIDELKDISLLLSLEKSEVISQQIN